MERDSKHLIVLDRELRCGKKPERKDKQCETEKRIR